MGTFEQLQPKINAERLKELTGLKPEHVLENGLGYSRYSGHLSAEILIPMTKEEWDSLWQPEPKTCACEQQPAPDIQFITYQEPEPEPLTDEQSRLIEVLKALGADGETTTALIHIIAAGMQPADIRQATNNFAYGKDHS